MKYHPEDINPANGAVASDARKLTIHERSIVGAHKRMTTPSGRNILICQSRAVERETDWRKVEPSDSRFDIPFQRIAEVNGIQPGTPEYRACFQAWANAGKRRYEQIKEREEFTRYTLYDRGAEYDADTYRPIEVTEVDTHETHESN
jgi:hypothetical protein